jgi:PEP-CTERM motif
MHSRKSLRLVAMITALTAAGLANAASEFNLRNAGLKVNWSVVPDDATLGYDDWFNNNDPQTGGAYFGGPTTPAPLYSVQGSVAGAESTPGDFTIGGAAVGQLKFSQANATAPAPLVINGSNYTDQTNRILLLNPVGAGPLTTRFRSNFEADAAWSFVTPDVNTRYGMRLNDSTGGSFDDVISLDIINAGGNAAAQMRRIAGVGSSRTITEIYTFDLSSALFNGYSLGDVTIASMHMYYYGNSQPVEGQVELYKVTNGGADIALVGDLLFSHRYEIFHGEDFTRLQIGANWTTPVPEPATYALMALGLAGVAGVARRRQAR